MWAALVWNWGSGLPAASAASSSPALWPPAHTLLSKKNAHILLYQKKMPTSSYLKKNAQTLLLLCKNCECCPCYSLFKSHNVNINIVVDNLDNFWQSWPFLTNFDLLTILTNLEIDKLDNFENLELFDNFWQSLQFWIFLTSFKKFWDLSQFLTKFTIFDNFRQLWIFTIETICTIFYSFDNIFFTILIIVKTILKTCDIWDTDNWLQFWQYLSPHN